MTTNFWLPPKSAPVVLIPLTLHTNPPSPTDVSVDVPLSQADFPASSTAEVCPAVGVTTIETVLPLSACTTHALSCDASATFHVRLVALFSALRSNKSHAFVL